MISGTFPDPAIHVVCAWATDYALTLGQVAVDSKSREIAAIPEIFDMIDRENTIITIDALDCQKSIVTQVIDGGGDTTCAVKDNHPKLAATIAEGF